MTRPRVLHLIKGLGIGGAERLISEGARFWDRDRFDYSVGYFLPWKDQLVPELDRLDVPVHFLGRSRGVSISSPVSVRRLVTGSSVDLLHIHSPGIAWWARLAHDGARVVYTEHNLVHSYHPLTRRANAATYRWNDASIAVSEAVADSVEQSGKPRPRVVPNGVAVEVDAADRAAVRNELGIRRDAPLVVHVGNIRPGKGHENLVLAARRALETRPDATFVSIGVEKVAGALDELRSSASDLGESMRFLGRRAEATAFTSAADVFVNPSEIEGLPVAVLEAMCLGTPVVATAAGGVPAVIEDGVTGWLVPVSDPEALAEGVLTALGNPPDAASRAERARKVVHDRFSLETMVRAYEEIYAEVLDR